MNLRFYLDHGMSLIDVLRMVSLQQTRWLAAYIEKNSTFRATASNDFLKEFSRLMNNSIFWKTCENHKKRTDIKPINHEQMCKTRIEKPHCMVFKIFDEQMAGFMMLKIKTLLNNH